MLVLAMTARAAAAGTPASGTAFTVVCFGGGTILVLLALVDVFYTVLLPGSGRGPVRRRLAWLVRGAFRRTRHLPPRLRRRVLAYAGPTEITASLLSWFSLLLVGWAAIYRPALGGAVTAAQGPTDRSWGTALYFSGYDLTTLGLGDLIATTPAYRVLVVAEAATGFMSFTLAISYFISVYSTLTRRNTFAMALHDRSSGTGCGSEVVRALWNEGPVVAALHLTEMAAGLRDVLETHRAYPVLRSFHYQREYDALPQMLLTCWETITLLRTSVDLGAHDRPELTGGSLDELEAAAAHMTISLGGSGRDRSTDPGPSRLRRWREHHAEMLGRMASGGVPVRTRSVQSYLDARAGWDDRLARVAAELLHDWEGQHPHLASGAAP